MTHRRHQLRAAFVARLAQNITPPPAQGQQPGAPTYRTAAEDRVHSGRLMPVEEPELPAIIIHTREKEKILDRSTSGWNGYEKRRAIVSVIVVAQSFDDIDADLDLIADQVEAALQAWVIPGFESADPFLVDSDMADPDFEGSLATGALTLRYAVDYMTPYRSCSDPYVDPDAAAGDGPLERSGAYPGGQVTPGCPADNTGEVCPIGTAELFSQEEPIN
jgi:hypothetical protein